MRDSEAVNHIREIVEAIRTEIAFYASRGMTAGEVAYELSRLDDALAILDVFQTHATAYENGPEPLHLPECQPGGETSLNHLIR